MEFDASTYKNGLEAIARAEGADESVVINEGPNAMARARLLDDGLIASDSDPNRGGDRIVSVHLPRLTSSGRAELDEALGRDAMPTSGPTDHPFHALTPDQVRAVEIAWSSFVDRREWPIFQYVESFAFRENIDLQATLRSMPAIGASYRPVWYQSVGGIAQPESPVGVTVAGLMHLPTAHRTVDDFLLVLRDLARRLHSMPLDPSSVQSCSVRFADLAAVLSDGAPSTDLRRVQHVQALLSVEPATWQGTGRGDGTGWTWEVARLTGRFHDVADVDDYLGRLTALLQSPVLPALSRSAETRAPVPPMLVASPVRLGDLIDAELWEHVEALYEIGRWDTLAREACTFLEDFLRRIGRPEDQQLSGTDLINAVLHDKNGSHPLTPTGHAGEAEGWHLYARGLFMAVRNASGHRINMAADERHAVGVLGAVSLLITQVRASSP